jgi:hypothetical protein
MLHPICTQSSHPCGPGKHYKADAELFDWRRGEIDVRFWRRQTPNPRMVCPAHKFGLLSDACRESIMATLELRPKTKNKA